MSQERRDGATEEFVCLHQEYPQRLVDVAASLVLWRRVWAVTGTPPLA